MSAADPYIHEEAVENYRHELCEEVHAFYLSCRSERIANAALELWVELTHTDVSLIWGEQELATLQYNYVCDGLDYGDLAFREGAD